MSVTIAATTAANMAAVNASLAASNAARMAANSGCGAEEVPTWLAIVFGGCLVVVCVLIVYIFVDMIRDIMRLR